MKPSPYEELIPILAILRSELPKFIDGKQAITEMKNQGSRNWKQMEWIGFWFEHFVERHVIPKLGGRKGPTYSTTDFDFKKHYVWDLKAHPNESKSLILNDQVAIQNCISLEDGLGFIIVSGDTQYDDVGQSFKKWHDSLKGNMSNYEIERIKRGAPSRRRKTCFSPKELHAVWFSNIHELHEASLQGWLKPFQQGMRNSNGKPRPSKYQMKIELVPQFQLLDRVLLD